MGVEENELKRQCQYIEGLKKDTVLKIQRMLYNHNVLINAFKTAI